MTNRQRLDALNLWDDKLEAQLLEIMEEKDEALELERAKVPDEVWAIENRLMEMEAKNVVE